MAEQEPQNKKTKEKKQTSKGSKVNALVILVCIDLIGLMASLYSLKAFTDANNFLIAAALTLVFSVITAMVYVQMKHQDEEDRQRVAGDVAEALSAIIEITKNDQQLMDKKIDDLSDEYQVPAQEIINALKALAKVSLGRSKENATALINSNEAVVTQVMDLQDRIDALEKKINEVSENDLSKAIDDNSHKVVVGLDDLTHDVQRLDQDMRRLEKVTKDLEMHPTVMQSVPMQTQPVNNTATEYFDEPAIEEPVEELNEDTTSETPDESLTEEVTEPSAQIDSDELQEENTDSDLDLSEELEPPADDETETVTDDDLTSMLEDETGPDSDDVDTGDDDLDLTIDDSSEDQEIGPDDLNIDETGSEPEQTEEASEPVAEQPEPLVEEQPEPTPAPIIDTDPNKQLSADEIAALFAQADNTSTAEEAKENDAPEQVEEEKPEPESTPEPAIDTSDPNKQLSADEIAALFAQANGGSTDTTTAEEPVIDEEPVSEENVSDDTTKDKAADAPSPESEKEQPAEAPQVSGDPNRMMTPEEIEALFSNVS